MIGTRRGFGSLHQAIIGALLGFVLVLPIAAAAEPAAEAAAPQHGGGGFALLLLDYRQDLERLTEGCARARPSSLRAQPWRPPR
jgi:hypothetical protein